MKLVRKKLLALFIISLCIVGVNHVYEDVSAESYEGSVGISFTLNPTINVTVSGDLVISNLTPGDYKDSNNITVTASSNSIAGYSLYANTGDSSNNSNELRKDGTSTTNKFTSITTDVASLSDFTDNTWGYSYCNVSTNCATSTNWTNYSYLPKYSDSNDKLLIANNTNTTTSLEFKIGARASTNQIAGEYTNVINFIGIANPNPQIPTMQNLDPSLCTTTPRMALDTRDNQYYLIARAADGNCWMLQNLKLGASTSTLNLTSDTSDVDSNGFTLTNKLSDGKFHAYTIDNVPSQNNSSEYYCTEAYGCYYNWYTTTAGHGTTWVTSGNVDYSICPAGWALPTGGSGGQFQALATSYGNSGPAMLVDNPTVATENTTGKIPGLLLSGLYNDQGSVYLEERGLYWSRTTDNAQLGHRLYLSNSGVWAADSTSKYLGQSVRCLLSPT